MKRTISFLLVFVLVSSMLLPAAFAEGESQEGAVIPLDSLQAFLYFAENCQVDTYSAGKTFSLTTDLDLSDADFEAIPYFAGTFLGNNHIISGLDIQNAGSRMGLFRQLAAGACIRDLRVKGNVSPAGTRVDIGGLVGLNSGRIEACTFVGSVAGLENVGGLVGTNSETGVVSNCSFQGSIIGEHQVGGIAGENKGLVSACTNSGAVNTVPIVPETTSSFDISSFSEEDFLNLTNIGGIVGENYGSVVGSHNGGDVGYKNTGYNIGGIAGKSLGYLNNCDNRGEIRGRRDAGGIAGQLVPSAVWDFSDGKLDDLSGAISYMHYLLNDVSQNAGDHSTVLYGQLQNMSGYTAQALEAVKNLLLEYRDTGDMAFADTSELTEALNNMYAQTGVLAGSAGELVGDLATDIQNIAYQMGYIFNLLFSLVSDDTGGLYQTEDLSFSETYEHDEGAVAACVNTGDVQAENNAGGIVGTIAFEVAFDMEDRLDVAQLFTTNARELLFAVVRDCESYSEVTVKESAAGGIVGSMDIGAVVSCVGMGAVTAQNGDYVGGIAGDANGTLANCWSRALLHGGKYVGGIAGLGSDIQSCRAWPVFEAAEEYKGSIAGWADGDIRDNYYVKGSVGGVDGVSLHEQTDALPAEQLLALDGAPDGFDILTVSFSVNGQLVQTVTVPFGGSIDKLPDVPNDGVHYWEWDAFDSEHIFYSMTIDGKYRAPASVIASEGDFPLFLVEGVFYDGQALTTIPYEADVPDEELITAYTLFVNDYDGAFTVRMRNDEDGTLYLVSDEESLEPCSYRRDGLYIAFPLDNGGSFVYVRTPHTADPRTVMLTGGSALLALLIVIPVIRMLKKKKYRRKKSERR